MKQTNTEPPVICPQCGYKEAIKKGTREHKSGLKVTRYQCKKCGHKFTPSQAKMLTRGKKHQTGKTLIELDKARTAKLPGKRIVHHPDGTTSVYWEFRRNRSDIDPKKRL
jgi:DNA-directed RNA polymerase subunit RPC12/RpoP